MKSTDPYIERFEEVFYADPSTAFIKPKDNEYIKITKSTFEKRMRFLEMKKPYVIEAWERYINSIKQEVT